MDPVCIDCGVPVNKDGNRCKRCSALNRWAKHVETHPLRPCKRCGKPIDGRFRSKAVYCSNECRNLDPAARPGRSLNRVTKTCPHCKRDYAVPVSNAARYNYCSKACSTAARGRDGVCKRCGRSFRYGQKEIRHYCCETCRRPPTVLACTTCGTAFRVVPSLATKRKHCSFRCYVASSETDIERRTRELLEARGVVFEGQAQIGPWVVDFLVGDLVIEADGTYWHSLGRDTDARKTNDLERRGYTVWRVPGEQILAESFPQRLDERLAVHAVGAASS